MKAVVTTGNGGYEMLDYRDVPRPQAEPGELLLKVLAAGVNNTEINTRLGWYSSKVTDGTCRRRWRLEPKHAIPVHPGHRLLR